MMSSDGLFNVHIAFPNKINKNEISNVEIMVSNSSEQEELGIFFTEFDNLIALQQQKLQNIKKAYLNEMCI